MSDMLTKITIHPDVNRPKVKRFGINIGYHEQFGAAQILKNVIVNPGFEASHFGTVFHVAAGATDTRIPVDNWQTKWNNDSQNIGQPADFWNEAEIEIVSGKGKHRAANVVRFAHENGQYVFYTSKGSVFAQYLGS